MILEQEFQFPGDCLLSAYQHGQMEILQNSKGHDQYLWAINTLSEKVEDPFRNPSWT